MAKTKIAAVEDGLKNAAVAVGAAIGSLAHKVGIGGTSTPKKKAAKKAVKKAVSKTAKKAAPAKKVAAKKVVAKKAAAKKSAAKKK